MKLMIIESPGKRVKLEEIMAAIRPGEEWRIVPSIGHIRDLPATGNNENEITTGVRTDLTPVYQLTERGEEVAVRLKKAVSQATEIYLATDPDREGESIAWHIKEAIGIRNPIRVSFNEVTKERVAEALSKPGRIDMKMVAAQEARRVADRLFGYLVSTELRRQTGEKLSAGRVQSVAVYLVVLREREIRAFKSTLHYGAELSFAAAKPGEHWVAEWMTLEGFTTKENPYFMDKPYAELVAGVGKAIVISCENKPRLRNPPAPFISSSLQQAASNKLRWNPDKTMKIAQALFDQGHISYHRTDNPNVSEESMPAIRAAAQAIGMEAVAKRRTWKAKDGAQEGHPGVTPTHWEVEAAGETSEQQELYKLIRTRALASQLMAANYDSRTVILKAADPVGGKQVLYGATGESLVEPGWLRLLDGDAASDEDETNQLNPIPQLEPGQTLNVLSGKLLEKKTKAPKRYTEASLVGALEKEGIGRPSTYAAILNNISTRNYVTEVARFLTPTPVGELVIDRLEGKFSFLQITYTRDLETDLDLISTGQTQYKPVMGALYGVLQNELEGQKSVPTFKKEVPVYPCPDCQKPLRRIANGANGAFWGCTGHPACEVTLPDANGVPGVRKVVELSNFACKQCGKALIHRVKKVRKGAKGGYNFWGCSGFKDGCTFTYPNLTGDKPDLENGKAGK
jgi:DNA topoisomerase-1